VRPVLLAAALWLLTALVARDAAAEPSAWIAASGGTTFLTTEESDIRVRGSMAFDLGIGSSPQEVVLFGGLVRWAPIVEEGSDLQFLARGASRGFQTGDFGFAVDLGGYLRLFEPSEPGGGFVGAFVVGAPLGLQLSLSGHAGTQKSFGGAAVLGFDLLRLTIYRQSLTAWWPNPLSPSEPAKEPSR
jgi:hypothetical protein